MANPNAEYRTLSSLAPEKCSSLGDAAENPGSTLRPNLNPPGSQRGCEQLPSRPPSESRALGITATALSAFLPPGSSPPTWKPLAQQPASCKSFKSANKSSPPAINTTAPQEAQKTISSKSSICRRAQNHTRKLTSSD